MYDNGHSNPYSHSHSFPYIDACTDPAPPYATLHCRRLAYPRPHPVS